MNKIIIIGNLGQDPEMRYTTAGHEVTNISVASNRRYKTSSGETRDETQWFRVSAFGRLAQIAAEHLHKGRQVCIEGRLTVHAYTDREGQPRASADVVATEIHFLQSGQGNNSGGGRNEGSQGSNGDNPYDAPPFAPHDDLPF